MDIRTATLNRLTADIHAATEFAKRLRLIARRAEMAGHSRERILEELIFVAALYESRVDQLDAMPGPLSPYLNSFKEN